MCEVMLGTQNQNLTPFPVVHSLVKACALDRQRFPVTPIASPTAAFISVTI
jgi:hypothetical protein